MGSDSVSSKQYAMDSGDWPAGITQEAMGSKQWAMGSKQLAVESGKWTGDRKQWAVNRKQWALDSGWVVNRGRCENKAFTEFGHAFYVET